MLYNFSIDDLISFFTIGALLIVAIYHTVLLYYNRIKLLSSYSIYLWASLLFVIFANVTKNLNPNQAKIGFAISSSILWFSYLLYFRFILITISPFKIKKSTPLRYANSNWLIFIIGAVVNIIAFVAPKNLTAIFSTIAFLYNGFILLFGITILFILFKEKRNFVNKNILGGSICMLFFNVFNVIARYNNENLFGIPSISYICLAYFTEIIIFSIAISYKMKFDLDEKYKTLAKIKIQELELEIEKKKASDILLTHTLAIQNQRTKAIIEQKTVIGRKLHDDLSGSLVTLRYLIQDFRAKAKDANDKEKYDILEAEISNIYKDTRNYSHELTINTETADNEISYDILNYLEKVAEQFAAVGLVAIQINMNAEEINNNLDSKQTRQLYFILKECITNTIKHTTAKNIWISAQFIENNCKINFKDDGNGFNVSQPEGLGIKGIRESINELNGSFEINTSNQGTTVSIGFNVAKKVLL